VQDFCTCSGTRAEVKGSFLCILLGVKELVLLFSIEDDLELGHGFHLLLLVDETVIER
jgi:hypothetical protein